MLPDEILRRSEGWFYTWSSAMQQVREKERAETAAALALATWAPKELDNLMGGGGPKKRAPMSKEEKAAALRRAEEIARMDRAGLMKPKRPRKGGA